MPDLRGMTLKQLRALDAVVRHGGVTAAGRALSLTPPAVASQLKTLENFVGAPLLDRAEEGVAPTEIGQALLETARDVEELIERTHTRVAALRSGAAGSVIFGAVSTAKYIAPRMAAQFQAANPGVSVKLAIGNRGEIIRGLERNLYDVALMGRPPAHLPIQSEMLGPHPHVVIAAADHRLAARARVAPEDLREERFLSREVGSGTRLLMNRFLAGIGARRELEVVEMGTNETIKQAVMAGLGIALISAHTCLTELEVGKLVALPVKGMPITRRWFLTRRTDRPTPRATQTFIEFVFDNRAALVPAAPSEP